MARLLVVNTNREHGPFPIPPIGACQVAEYAAQAGHDVSFLDLCFSRRPEDALADRLRSSPPDAIGLSVRNIDNSNMAQTRFYLPFVRRLVEVARADARTPIVVGGAGVSVAPREVMEYLDADYAIAGEGEAPMVRLLAGASPASIPNVFSMPQAPSFPAVPGAAALPSPSRGRMWRWVSTEAYFRRNASLPFQSKRGCIFRCVYCTYTNVEGTSYQVKGAAQAIAELAAVVAATDARRVEFVDATFNVPESYAMQLCEQILMRPELRGVSFATSGFNPSVHPPELFSLMERTGFVSIVCTPESASDAVLCKMRKGFTTYHLARTIEERRKSSIPFLWVFLLGGPGETEGTVDETFRFIERNIPADDGVFLTAGLRVYPYTELAEISGASDTLLDPVFYISPGLDPLFLTRRIGEEMRKHPNYVTISDTQNRLLPALNRGLGLLKSDLPLWRFAPAVNWARHTLGVRGV